MEENLLYIVLGAAGTLLALLALLLVHEFCLLAVLPLWRRLRYRGPKLAGGWKGLGNRSAPVAGEWTEVGLSLQQQLREVHGMLWIRHCTAASSEELLVPVAGRVAGGYVTLGPSQDGEGTPPLATALLKVEARGGSLNGQLLYRDAATDTLTAIDMSVHRAASMALPRLRPLGEQAGALLPAAA